MERTPVKSSNVESVGYDADSRTLEVAFKSGAVYQYIDVPQNHITAILAADSVGKYMSARIKGRYEYRQLPPAPESPTVTLSGKPPDPAYDGPAPQPVDPATGMHGDYYVLSPEERAKGFVRPLRLRYKHTGRRACGKQVTLEGDYTYPAGKVTMLCADPPGHDGECTHFAPASVDEIKRHKETGFLGGCDGITVMNQAIAETYARQPGYYTATFCAVCRLHLPVGKWGEFRWLDDDSPVGT